MKAFPRALIAAALLTVGAVVAYSAASNTNSSDKNSPSGKQAAVQPNKPLRITLPPGAAPRPPVKPLVLPRLNGKTSAETGSRLDAEKFAFDALDLPAGVERDSKGNGKGNGLERRQSVNAVNQVMVDGGSSYDRVLRGLPDEVLFVSFVAAATPETIVGVGGAWLAVTADGLVKVGERKGKTLEWRQVGYARPIVEIGGKDYVILPTVTVRIDPSKGVWDYFAESELVAEDLKLDDSPPGSNRDFNLTAGPGGASLTGLAVSSENPLFLDENRNGLEDTFEKRKGSGLLLPDTANGAERTALAKARRDENNVERMAAAPDREALKAKANAKKP